MTQLPLFDIQAPPTLPQRRQRAKPTNHTTKPRPAPPAPTPRREAEDEAKVYLWVNITDLDAIGTMPVFGTPLNFMIRPELGDERQPGGWYSVERLDDAYVIIHTTPARAAALKDVLEMFGRRKMKRAVRTRQTNKLPGTGWRYVPEG